MYSKLPNLFIGFHGCDQETHDKVVAGKFHLKYSENIYDWLGHGIYFWEHNLERAVKWAKQRKKGNAAVIGAVIDLGYCLNLTDSASNEVLRFGHELLTEKCKVMNEDMPENVRFANTGDELMRNLDCAVIQEIHRFNRQMSKREFDSVRGVFTEGKPVYKGSGILENTHVQLCVRNPNCIKGYFSPLNEDAAYVIP